MCGGVQYNHTSIRPPHRSTQPQQQTTRTTQPPTQPRIKKSSSKRRSSFKTFRPNINTLVRDPKKKYTLNKRRRGIQKNDRVLRTMVSKLAMGTKVRANFHGSGQWYPGTIMGVRDPEDGEGFGYDILYDDGDGESNVMRENILLEGEEEGQNSNNINEQGGEASNSASTSTSSSSCSSTIATVTDSTTSEVILPNGFKMGEEVEIRSLMTKKWGRATIASYDSELGTFDLTMSGGGEERGVPLGLLRRVHDAATSSSSSSSTSHPEHVGNERSSSNNNNNNYNGEDCSSRKKRKSKKRNRSPTLNAVMQILKTFNEAEMKAALRVLEGLVAMRNIHHHSGASSSSSTSSTSSSTSTSSYSSSSSSSPSIVELNKKGSSRKEKDQEGGEEGTRGEKKKKNLLTITSSC